MHRLQIIALIIGSLCSFSVASRIYADTPAGLIERLKQTRAVNIDVLIETQFSETQFIKTGRAGDFSVADPYAAQANETVSNWLMDTAHQTGVCAIRFTTEEQMDYELRGFESAGAATAGGFTVTHQGRCGSCSTLKDLAIYLSTPDLTTPARQCARRFGMSGRKQCYEEVIGLTPYCAESWAYNARYTKQQCLGVCIGDYGFINLLFNRYPGSNMSESGQLRPCLQCDEEKSGPGFKYSAGRTRRNSGIESAIPRAESEIYPVDHSAYFH